MARPVINQPMPPITSPFAVIEHPSFGRLEVFPTEEYRRAMESENRALFDDGADDVTQGLSEGGVELGTGTTGDYVQSVTGSGNATATPSSGEGAQVVVGFSNTPTFASLTTTGNYVCQGSITITGTVDGRDVATDGTKLDGIAIDATKNATDAALRDRATHNGAQAISTVTGLQDALDGKVDAAIITDAVASHDVNMIFSDTEVEAALDALGAKINEVIAALS